jgi:hypothetical protein
LANSTIRIAFLAASPTRVTYTRRPPHSCSLRSAAANAGNTFDVIFDRLNVNDDLCPNRQSDETIEVQAGFIDRWELLISSGVLTEKIDLLPDFGLLTTRQFFEDTEVDVQQAPF